MGMIKGLTGWTRAKLGGESKFEEGEDVSAEEQAQLEPELQRRLDSLMESAPSDATARFLLKRIHGGYIGLLKIASQQGRFTARSASGRVGDTIEAAFRDLRGQLDSWRKNRFAE